MKIRLLTVTHKSPSWIEAGYTEYAKRLPANFSLELVEIPAEKRGSNPDVKRIMEREGEKLLAAIKPQHRVIALEVKGKLWSTEQLAQQLKTYAEEGHHLDLLVGGPDGLSKACLEKAHVHWSLSPLTFPHFIVKLIVAEQIYRAFTILQNHPYHRA